MDDVVQTKTYAELLSDLRSDRTTIVFKSLCALKTTQLGDEAFGLLKNVAENATTFKNKKLAFALITRRFPDRVVEIEMRMDNNLGYIYFIREDLHGHVKIGRTRNLNKRMRLFAAGLPFEIELLAHFRSYNYEHIELELHKHYATKRVRAEWFMLDAADISAIRSGSFPPQIKQLIRTENDRGSALCAP